MQFELWPAERINTTRDEDAPLIVENVISGALGLFTTVQHVIERAVILTRGAELAAPDLSAPKRSGRSQHIGTLSIC